MVPQRGDLGAEAGFALVQRLAAGHHGADVEQARLGAQVGVGEHLCRQLLLVDHDVVEP